MELDRQKQQLIEYSKALEEEVARLTDELTKVSVRLTVGEVSRQEIDDLPELESLTTGYLYDESQAAAQSDTQRHPGSRLTDPHPSGFRALRMDKLSGKPSDNNFEAWLTISKGLPLIAVGMTSKDCNDFLGS